MEDQAGSERAPTGTLPSSQWQLLVESGTQHVSEQACRASPCCVPRSSRLRYLGWCHSRFSICWAMPMIKSPTQAWHVPTPSGYLHPHPHPRVRQPPTQRVRPAGRFPPTGSSAHACWRRRTLARAPSHSWPSPTAYPAARQPRRSTKSAVRGIHTEDANADRDCAVCQQHALHAAECICVPGEHVENEVCNVRHT